MQELLEASSRVSFPWGSQSPFPIWGDVAEVFLTFPGLRALTEEAASCGLSLDTHPTSGSSCSAWTTVKDVTDVPSSSGQCHMKSSFPSGLD